MAKEKDINSILNPGSPSRSGPAHSGGGREVQVDADHLKSLAGDAEEAERDIRFAVHKMTPDSEQGARALGRDWSTSAKLSELTAGRESALIKLGGQVGDVGPKLTKTAGNYMLAEALNRQVVQAITHILGD